MFLSFDYFMHRLCSLFLSFDYFRLLSKFSLPLNSNLRHKAFTLLLFREQLLLSLHPLNLNLTIPPPSFALNTSKVTSINFNLLLKVVSLLKQSILLQIILINKHIFNLCALTLLHNVELLLTLELQILTITKVKIIRHLLILVRSEKVRTILF